MIDVRSEISLVLCCARTRLHPQQSDRIRALAQQKLDWDYVLQFAVWHRVAALMYCHLNALCPRLVPADTLAALRAHAQDVAINNLKLAAELRNVLSLFKTHGIAAVPFKGAATAALIYGDLSRREFGDLDLLLHREQVPPAIKLLTAAGYRPHRNHEIAGGQEKAFLQFETTYTVVHETTQIAVDLHWEITRKYFSIPITLEQLAPRLHSVALSGTEILSLAPEDLLLILCIHGAKHLWTGLDWICDIAELIARYQNLNWARTLQQAESLRSTRIVLLGLRLAHDLLEAELPFEIQERLRNDRAINKLAAQVCANLPKMIEAPKTREKFFFLLQARERVADKIRYLWRCTAMPSGRDLLVLQLPEFLRRFYWLLKPLRLLGEIVLPKKNAPPARPEAFQAEARG